VFSNNFDIYLRYTIKKSRYNCFAHKYFKYSVNKQYIFETNIQELNRRLTKYKIEIDIKGKKKKFRYRDKNAYILKRYVTSRMLISIIRRASLFTRQLEKKDLLTKSK